MSSLRLLQRLRQSLRLRLVLWVLALFAMGGLLALGLLERKVEQSYSELERSQALEDFGRLLRSLDDEIAKRDRVLREWSLWEDFYDWAGGGQAGFAAKNLTPRAVANSGLLWLGLHDLQGRMRLGIGGGDPSLPLLPDALAAPVRQQLSSAVLARQTGTPCGLGQVEGLVLILCQRPLTDDDVATAPRGWVAIADRFDAAVVQAVALRGGFALSLRPWPEGGLPPSQATGTSFSSLAGSGELYLETEREQMRLRWPLRDLAGTPVGLIDMRWPRDIVPRGQALLDQVRWSALGLMAAVALGVLLLVDRVVVARLVRLRRELADIRSRRDWSAQVEEGHRDEIGELASGANHLLGVIGDQVQALEQLSRTDALTGLANRRYFGEQLAQALAAGRRSGSPPCLLLIDIDHFKRYNDRYGHQQGDRALQAVSECLRQAARRPGDLAARMGGEEFALLLEGGGIEGARHCAEGLRAALHERAIVHEAGGPGGLLTLSMGLACAQVQESAEALYLRADEALYRAKNGGRDRLSE